MNNEKQKVVVTKQPVVVNVVKLVVFLIHLLQKKISTVALIFTTVNYYLQYTNPLLIKVGIPLGQEGVSIFSKLE